MNFQIPTLFALLCLAAAAPQAHALEVTVYGRDKVIYSNDTFVRANESVESITQRTVGQEHRVTANQFGVTAIDDLKQDTATPGRGAGWCYAVDGKLAVLEFRALKLSNKNLKLVWFFGVSTQGTDGQWSTCKPLFADSSTVLN